MYAQEERKVSQQNDSVSSEEMQLTRRQMCAEEADRVCSISLDFLTLLQKMTQCIKPLSVKSL